MSKSGKAKVIRYVPKVDMSIDHKKFLKLHKIATLTDKIDQLYSWQERNPHDDKSVRIDKLIKQLDELRNL